MRKRRINARMPWAFQVVAATGFLISCSGIYRILAENDLNSLSFDKPYTISQPVENDPRLYEKRLESLSFSIKLPYNKEVKGQIDTYLGKRRAELKKFITKRYEYDAVIEDILVKNGVPGELKGLVMVESGYDFTAGSHKGAVGFWQLMPATARAYDLNVNNKTDDRKDPYKSTEAAAAHLKDLYRIHKDWLLVIAAYNCGSNKVHQAVKKSGGIRDFWKIKKHLPKETREFVPKFIATVYVMEFYGEHDIKVYHHPRPRFDVLPGAASAMYIAPVEL